MRRTPLDRWVAARLGLRSDRPSPEEVEERQLERLRESATWAAEHSPFYGRRLAGRPGGWPRARADLESFPLTSAEDLREEGPRFLCVSQDEVGRVVTLQSSGTTGPPKRLWFTPADQESTIDFFQAGMSALVERGDRVLILLPGALPGSVGALLSTALERMGVTPIPHGFVHDLAEVAKVVRRSDPSSVVGMPVQVLGLALQASGAGRVPFRPRTALLTADHVPASLVRRLEEASGCQVFQHYGMTETGLGAAVDCEAHAGYHLRDPDLLFEIIDPGTGRSLPDGVEGEMVVSTLARRGMPLFRYRTGDRSRFLPGRCACGSALRRLARVRGRIDAAAVDCGAAGTVTLPVLDEILFAVPGLVDFTAAVSRSGDRDRLSVTAYALEGGEGGLGPAVLEAVRAIPAVKAAIGAGRLTLSVVSAVLPGGRFTAPGKRAMVDLGVDG
ncbi:MAG TPA: AMP-binding protein [Anaeromyxobacter sp.]|nr:AMP-binding protein [Anaeromyxobacter sp.]